MDGTKFKWFSAFHWAIILETENATFLKNIPLNHYIAKPSSAEGTGLKGVFIYLKVA